jgi:predicted AAA+ superfamily ATPase
MHTRNRHIAGVLLKRAKIFPVLGVLGARQVGKSTFLMHQWSQLEDANYN